MSWITEKGIAEKIPINEIGVLVKCFLANASIMLPTSSSLIVTKNSLLMNPLIVAVCGAIGAALGEMIGYYAGRCLGNVLSEKIIKRIKIIKHKYLIVFLFSLLVIPIFDIIGILSGVTKMNKLKFFGICFAGNLIKLICFICFAYKLFPALSGR